MGREENIQVFEDTQQKCRSDSRLIQAIAQANAAQRLILESDSETWKPPRRYMRPAQVVVSRKRTLEAASAYPGKKVCVLNFASATNPGGGVMRGSSAQEEAICRCSSLYFNLTEKRMWEGFYGPHRAQRDSLHNNDCIYTPGVVVFKSDDAVPQALPFEKWYTVNVLTCAAPNLRERPSNPMNDGDGARATATPRKAHAPDFEYFGGGGQRGHDSWCIWVRRVSQPAGGCCGGHENSGSGVSLVFPDY